MDEPLERSTDELISVEVLWSGIEVGDLIELEADLFEGGDLILNANQSYLVVAKQTREQGAHYDAFIVEHEGSLVAVSPAFISNYRLNHAATQTN